MMGINKTLKRIACILMVLMLLLAVGCAMKAPNPSYSKSSSGAAEAPAAEPPRGEGEFGFNYDTGAAEDAVEYEAAPVAPQEDSGGGYGNKIIKNAYMQMETYEFDKTLQEMQNLLESMGGYVESSSVSGRSLSSDKYYRRYAHFEFRVPEASFMPFINSVGDLGNVVDSSQGGQDISFQYYDTEARLKSLEVQEERLIAILEKADKIEDVIALEQELSRVRYEIESLQGQLRQWDNLVSFSRVSVDVTEVKEYTEITEEPDTLWERIGDTLSRSFKSLVRFLENLLVAFTAALPFLLLLAVVALVIILIVRVSTRRSKARKGATDKERENE